MQELKVIYEDNHIIVVEKMVNIPVQGDKTNDISMLDIIKKYIKEKYNKKGNVYLGLVHRLDRPVGGIMVFAKTSKAASRLSENIRTKEFKKTYLAVINGVLSKKEDELIDYLYKDEALNKSKVVSKDKKDAKLSKLKYKVLKEKNNLSLVEIELDTGRHHQIRVQFANMGHSLYGDQKYGIGPHNKQIALWAYKLEFKHPVKDEVLCLCCEPENIGIWKDFM